MDNLDAVFGTTGGDKTASEKADRLRLEGNDHFRLNDFENAVEFYTKSLDTMTTVPALLNRSFCYVKIERFEEALRDAEEALQIEPNNLKAKCRRGIALRELGKYQQALKEFWDCLEHESESNNFQKLYDECQLLSDKKMFPTLNLEIVNYHDPTHGEMHLDLFTGHPSSPGIKLKPKRFGALITLREYLKKHGAFGSLHIQNSVINEELMEFFRSIKPVALAPAMVEFYNVRCTSDQFSELFGGDLFCPLSIWFSRMERTEYDMSTAFRTLAAIRDAKFVRFGANQFVHFSSENLYPRQVKVDLNALLDLLHQPHPDIPAHIRASPTFFYRTNLLTELISPEERVALSRSMAGRVFSFDLNHLNGADNKEGAKLADVIDQCKQRFQSARSAVSYALRLRFAMSQLDQVQTQDLVALFEIMQLGRSPTILHNGCGEKLTLNVTKKQFKQPKFLIQDEPNGEVVQLEIERTRAAAS